MSGEGIYDLEPAEDKPRHPAPPVAAAVIPPDGAPTPCPSCGYDLRGAKDWRCPECGETFTAGSLQRAKRKREAKVSESTWFGPALMFTVGTVAAAIMYGIVGATGGTMGVAAMLVYLAVNLLASIGVGALVYAVFCMTWLGWAQSIPVTILQVAGVYAIATAVGTLATLVIQLPIVPWLIGVVTLIGLLCKVLELEYNEAIAVAFISWVIKFIIGMLIVAAMFPNV